MPARNLTALAIVACLCLASCGGKQSNQLRLSLKPNSKLVYDRQTEAQIALTGLIAGEDRFSITERRIVLPEEKVGTAQAVVIRAEQVQVAIEPNEDTEAQSLVAFDDLREGLEALEAAMTVNDRGQAQSAALKNIEEMSEITRSVATALMGDYKMIGPFGVVFPEADLKKGLAWTWDASYSSSIAESTRGVIETEAETMPINFEITGLTKDRVTILRKIDGSVAFKVGDRDGSSTIQSEGTFIFDRDSGVLQSSSLKSETVTSLGIISFSMTAETTEKLAP
jgi:hypothetical protein